MSNNRPGPGTNYFGQLNNSVKISLTDDFGLGMEAECNGNPNVVAVEANFFNVGCKITRKDILTGSNVYFNTGTSTSPNWTLAGGGGSSITLETNGTPNGSQTLLNLISGTDIGIADDGSGNITFSFTGTSGGGTPASPDMSIQYNNSGSFGGASILYSPDLFGDGSDLPAFIGETGGNSFLGFRSGDATTSSNNNGSGFFLLPGNGDGSGHGGDLIIGAGGFGAGGNIGDGGGVIINAGSGGDTSGEGGLVNIIGGSSPNDNGGDINLLPGLGGNANGVIIFVDPATNTASRFNTSLLTADRIFSFPDKAGTFAMLSDITAGTVTSVASADGSITVTDPTTTVDLSVATAPAGALTGTTLKSTVVTSSLTSVGTLGGLTVTVAPTFSAMTLGSVLFAGTSGVLSQDNSKFFYDSTNHFLGLGTASPSTVLDIVGTSIRQSNTTTDATNKAFRFQTRNFTNAQNDFLLVFGQSKTSANTLILGGGQTGSVAASTVSIFTGAGNNTDTGTARLTVDASGNVLIASLTGSKVVFTDSSKNLTSTGIGTSSQFIKGDGSLDSNTYITGNQTITLSGDVTGSGTTAITTVVAAIAGTTVSGTTGSGNVVFATSPTLTTAVLGSSTATTQSPSDNSTKVATTAYVDAAVLGQNFKEATKVATTANLVGVYLSGVFTYTATGTDNIDGVNLALGDRVLVKNQTTTFQNGIYSVTTAGAIGVAGVLTRATDSNTSAEFKTGDSNFVTSGTVNSNTTWAYTGIDSPTLGTTAITYAQTAGQGTVTAGNGITVTGLSVAIDTSVTVDKTTAQTLTNKTLTSPILTTPDLGTPSALVGTNISGTGASFTAGHVTNATFTTALTVNTGTLTLTANAANTSVLTIGAGTVSVSGSNTGDQNLFSSIPVSGQTTVTANSATTALTFVAGTGMTITTDNTAKTITFASSGGSGLTVGTTTITSGANTKVLFDNSGVLGEYTISGSGNVAMTTSPSFTTPTLGVATATRLGIGAAADASKILYVTGDVSGGVATIERTNATTNAVVGAMIIQGTSSGTMADGFGSAFQFSIKDSVGGPNNIADIRGIRSGAANAGKMTFSTSTTGGTMTEAMAISNTQILTLTNAGTSAGSVATIDGTQTLTNKSIAIGQITGLGSGIATWLVTPSSANLASAITDETGSGLLVFGTAPSISGATLTTSSVNGVTLTTGGAATTFLNAAGSYTIPTGSAFPVQDVPILNGAVTPTNNYSAITSTPTGSVIFLGQLQATTVTIYRLIKDTTTSNYYITNSTTLTVDSSGLEGMAVSGSFLYVSAQISATGAVRRYAIADLSGVTTMTISGTNSFAANGLVNSMFADASNLYTVSSASTYRQYSISGTTVTSVTTIGFTSSGGQPTASISDGVNVWISDVSSINATMNIRKYALAGGAVVSTTSIPLFTGAYYAGTLPQLFMGSSSGLGIGWWFNWTNPTSATGMGIHLFSIALP